MTRVALQSLLWRRFRAVVTMLAIVLGVAMVAGTLVLTDTISRTFDRLFAGSHKGVSVVVSGRRVVDRSLGQSATVPAATLAAIRRVPGVAAAAGATDDDAQIIGRDGDRVPPCLRKDLERCLRLPDETA